MPGAIRVVWIPEVIFHYPHILECDCFESPVIFVLFGQYLEDIEMVCFSYEVYQVCFELTQVEWEPFRLVLCQHVSHQLLFVMLYDSIYTLSVLTKEASNHGILSGDRLKQLQECTPNLSIFSISCSLDFLYLGELSSNE